MTTTNQVAETILAQLGGARIAVMIGAKHIMHDGNKLIVRFAAKATNKANHFEVELAADDTYTVTFWKIGRGGLDCKEISSTRMVYADQLKRFVEKETGLYLSL